METASYQNAEEFRRNVFLLIRLRKNVYRSLFVKILRIVGISRHGSGMLVHRNDSKGLAGATGKREIEPMNNE